MGLNLNSLKNLPSAGTTESSIKENAPSAATASQTGAVSAQDIQVAKESLVVKEQTSPAPASGPKISLMKLKKASGMETVAPAPVEVVAKEEKSVAELEKELLREEPKSIVSMADQAAETSPSTVSDTKSEEAVTDIPSPAESIALDTDTQEMSESLSIMDAEVPESEQAKEEASLVQEEPKEFFPNFHITDGMKLDDDLVDLEDLITIKEHDGDEAQTIDATSIVSIADTTDTATIKEEVLDIVEISENTVPAISAVEEVATPSSIESVSTEVSETPSSVGEEVINTPAAITPEYVAEVKIELSEQRRGGFRFFSQNKTKIVAGFGIVLSLSVVAFFSNSLMPTDVETIGKSNVQEGDREPTVPVEAPIKETENDPAIDPTVPAEIPADADPAIPTETPVDIIPSVPVVVAPETPDYEIGKDYNVTKNTKKNVRSKATINTASGAEMPTP